MDEATPPTATDWADQATDVVENVVSTVREKAVVPAQRVTSNIVFGLIVLFFVIPAAVLFAIGLFHFVDNVLPGDAWSTWLLFGGIFLVAGTFVWTKRHPRRP